MADIVKARNAGNNSGPVLAPLYDAPIDCQWDSITTFPVLNQARRENVADCKSILSKLDMGTTLASIDGMTVTMVSKIGNDVCKDTVKDTVKVIGATNMAFVVEIAGTEYSVKKSIVRFIKAVA